MVSFQNLNFLELGSFSIKGIAAQHDEAWFRDRCDHILENNGTQKQFQEKCIAFLRKEGIIKEKPKGE